MSTAVCRGVAAIGPMSPAARARATVMPHMVSPPLSEGLLL
nr:hypothetical protein [Pararoseomonas indoligenes]